MPLDLKQLTAELLHQHGIRVDPDDPIMAVVTLNRLVFEKAVEEIIARVESAGDEFERAAERAQVRAGATLAQEIRDSVSEVRRELEKAAFSSGAGSGAVGSGAWTMFPVQAWVAVGLMSATALFGCGVWAGTLLR